MFCITQLAVNFLQIPVWISGVLIWAVWGLALTNITASVRKQASVIYGIAGLCAHFLVSGGRFSAQEWLYPNLNMLMLNSMSFLGLLNTNQTFLRILTHRL